jgi:protein TonB
MNHSPALSLSCPSGSTVRYSGVPQSTGIFWLAASVALALHAALLLCLNDHSDRAKFVPPKPKLVIVEWPPVVDDPPVAKPRELTDDPPAVRVPALPDIPQPVKVETIFTQLPDPVVPFKGDGKESLGTIPINYRRGPGDDLGTPGIFKPSELERVPEAVVQAQPDYPSELQRSGIGGTVRVGFIVDSQGRVVSLHVISSTNQGFERATLEALAKWKFRPGLKNGRKVNTRMEQPIEFNTQP